jgi:hypothetical protein
MSKVSKSPIPVMPSPAQRKWLIEEAKRLGESQATIIRSLIQREMDGDNERAYCAHGPSQ